MKMKITNATSKTIVLLNGTSIKPRKTVTITVKKGTEQYTQIKNLEKKGSIDIVYL